MKYILITKVENSDPIKKEYSSLRKIAQDLETTYCSCYSNFLIQLNQPESHQRN
jgi:hypothetical protein